jgi:hypothetical protein
VERAAAEFTLQAQIYTQAIRKLLPNVTVVEAALHFLAPGPDVEYEFSASEIGERPAAEALERALADIVRGGFDASAFAARPGPRCHRCRFAVFCPDAERRAAEPPDTSTPEETPVPHESIAPGPVQGHLFE